MRRVFSFWLAFLMLILLGCSAKADLSVTTKPATTEPATTEPATTEPATKGYKATEEDIAVLEKLYEGRVVHHGDYHVHTDSCGNSDGKVPITSWAGLMQGKDIDFAAVLDHRQTSHMYLDCWDDSVFLGACEGGVLLYNEQAGSSAGNHKVHLNYLFADPESAEKVFQMFPDIFMYKDHTIGGYHKTLTRAEVAQVIQAVQENGGFFVTPHPKLENYCIVSENPLDFWFADGVGLEVFYGMYGDAVYRQETKDNYTLWKQLLTLGKRVYATAGSDTHNSPLTTALSTVYTTEQSAKAYLECLRTGDVTPAPMGIRMAMGDTLMGGETSFKGKRLIFSVGDFHRSVLQVRKNFRVVLLSDEGIVFNQEFTAGEMAYFAIDADPNAKFYRLEIYDVDENLLIGISNPIWNEY